MTLHLRVSIAMATYNGERYLGEQLDSLALQTRLPDELIVSDDCSNDRTVAIIQEFESRSPFPVRVLRQEQNRGSSKNFDHAVASCTGDVIFLCDQDDVWMPDKVSDMVNAFIQSPAVGLVISNSMLVDDASTPIGRKLYIRRFPRSTRVYPSGEPALRTVLAAGLLFGHTMAFRCMPALCGPTARASRNWGQDCVRALVAGALSDVVVLPDALTKHRRHQAQLTHGHELHRTRWVRLWKAFASESGGREKRIGFAKKMLEISDLLKSLEADPAAVRFLEGTARFALFQASLNPSRMRRICPVLRNLLSGSYHTYANGFSTAARDALGCVDGTPAMQIETIELNRCRGSGSGLVQSPVFLNHADSPDGVAIRTHSHRVAVGPIDDRP